MEGNDMLEAGGILITFWHPGNSWKGQEDNPYSSLVTDHVSFNILQLPGGNREI